MKVFKLFVLPLIVFFFNMYVCNAFYGRYNYEINTFTVSGDTATISGWAIMNARSGYISSGTGEVLTGGSDRQSGVRSLTVNKSKDSEGMSYYGGYCMYGSKMYVNSTNGQILPNSSNHDSKYTYRYDMKIYRVYKNGKTEEVKGVVTKRNDAPITSITYAQSYKCFSSTADAVFGKWLSWCNRGIGSSYATACYENVGFKFDINIGELVYSSVILGYKMQLVINTGEKSTCTSSCSETFDITILDGSFSGNNIESSVLDKTTSKVKVIVSGGRAWSQPRFNSSKQKGLGANTKYDVLEMRMDMDSNITWYRIKVDNNGPNNYWVPASFVNPSEEITLISKPLGKIEVRKIDSDGNYVSGANLEIRDMNGTEIESWESGMTSKLISLSPGKYKLIETSAPTGYQKSNEEIKFTIKKDETISVSMTNTLKPVSNSCDAEIISNSRNTFRVVEEINDYYSIACEEEIKTKFEPGVEFNNNIKIQQGFSFGINITSNKKCTGVFNQDIWEKAYQKAISDYQGASGSERYRLEKIITELKDYVSSYNNWSMNNYQMNPLGIMNIIYKQKNGSEKIDTVNFVVSNVTNGTIDENFGSVYNLNVNGITNPRKFTYTLTDYKTTLSLPKKYLNLVDGSVHLTNCSNCIEGENKYYLDKYGDIGEYVLDITAKNLGEAGDLLINNNKCSINVMDMNMVYRHISVKNPFVSNDREIGSNWLNNNYSFVKTIDSDTWANNKTPLYVFDLGKQTIKDIKKSNYLMGANGYLGTCYNNVNRDAASNYICGIIEQ